MQKVSIGLAGFGTVGAGVYKHILRSRDLFAERLGVRFDLRKIAVRDMHRTRSFDPPKELFTAHWEDLIADPEIQVVVELMGGMDEPYRLVRQAIEAGKTVVTGNKALLARHGKEIFSLAHEKQVPIFYEAAVAGGIPIIKAMRESFVANRFERIDAILNGTSNYILTRMTECGMDFAQALKEAQEKGYAEADPSLDVNGWDAAHKAIILASLAYGFWIRSDQVRVAGIENINASDIRFADTLGYQIKLLASIRVDSHASVGARVVPTLIPKNHVLASVNGVFNAISLHGDMVGEALFYGQGAGQDPTSSAVLADLAEAALALQSPRRCYGFTSHDLYGNVQSPDDSVGEYYLRLAVEDRTGVLSQVAGVLAKSQIGISSVIQPEGHASGIVPLVIMVHHAPFGCMRHAVEEIQKLACVKSSPCLLNVESFT